MMYALLLCESDCSEEALIQGDAAFKLFSDLGDAMKALAANNMALAAIRASKYALAEYWLQLAEEACPSNSNLWRSYIVHTEGQLALATNRYADARAAFARALEVLPGERDDVSHTANLYLDIGRLHIVEGVAAKALASLDHALILAEDSGDAALVAKVHDALHDAYEKIGDFDSALRHCRKRGAALTRSAAAKSAEQIAVLKAAEALVHERAKWAAVRYSA
jgi:tetratricopeptide (TPR) repeat protein